jgi:hypothetical protein
MEQQQAACVRMAFEARIRCSTARAHPTAVVRSSRWWVRQAYQEAQVRCIWGQGTSCAGVAGPQVGQQRPQVAQP